MIDFFFCLDTGNVPMRYPVTNASVYDLVCTLYCLTRDVGSGKSTLLCIFLGDEGDLQPSPRPEPLKSL